MFKSLIAGALAALALILVVCAPANAANCGAGGFAVEGSCVAPPTPFQKNFAARFKPGAAVRLADACQPGYALCNGVTCTNTQNDPNNCGFCGDVCASGLCTVGTCVLNINTTTSLTTSATTRTLGQSVTFTATVSPSQGQPPSYGNVTFSDGATPLATVPVSNGHAIYTTTSLPAGSHSITAAYSGYSNVYSGSTSSAVGVTVTDATHATVAVSSLFNPSLYGNSVTLSALAASSSAPTGSMEFFDGPTSLGSGTINTLGAGFPMGLGDQHSCALTAAGGVQCWGENNYGQLGNNSNSGTAAPNPTPADVTGLTSGVVAVAAGGNHTCALTSAGGAQCWGDNYFGQLGTATNNSTSNPNPAPADVTGLTSGVVALATGTYHTCALTSAGGVKCWGWNISGELGTSTNIGNGNANPTPADVPGLTSGVVAIAAGANHTCALTSAGGVQCWGENNYGQLGASANSGTTTPSPTPADVPGLTSGVVAIAAGANHTCALTSAGGVQCWGENNYGQLGVSTNSGTTNPNPTPAGVTGLSSGVAAIALGAYHSCALTSAGGVQCWGSNAYGELATSTNNGTGTPNPTPADAGGLTSSIVAVFAGQDHTCALSTAGGIQCVGNNAYGQLGNATGVNSSSPNATPADVTNFGAGAALVYGQATLSTAALTAGSHNITAIYSGDSDHNPATSSAFSQVVDLAPSINSADHATFLLSQSGSFTVTTTAYPTPAFSLTGALPSGVSFTDNADGTATISGTPDSNSAGTYSLTIKAANGVGSDAQQSFTLTVGNAPAINSANSVSGSVGTPLSFAVTTTGSPAPSLGVTGSLPGGVSFTDNGDGTATFSGTPATGGAGSFPVTITASNGIGSDATQNFTFTIGKTNGVVSLTPSAASTAFGQSVTLTATVSAAVTPTGSVTFMDGAASLGTSNLSGSTATIATASLAVGSHSITALYNGNNDINATTSTSKTVTVSKGETTVSISAAPGSPRADQTVKLTATVSVTAPATGTPTGTMTFKEGSKTLGSVTISGGKASLSLSGLSTGSHTISANFPGTSTLMASGGFTSVTALPQYGPAFPINTTTKSSQQLPAIASLGNGFVVVWASNLQDGSGYGIYGQRFTAAAVKAGSEFRVNTTTKQSQTLPAVTSLKNGSFIAVWQSAGQDGSLNGIYGQRFSASGAKLGAEFRVNSTTAGDQAYPSISALADGGFVVAWQSNGQDGSGLGVYAQRFTATGIKSGAELPVNSHTAGDQSMPSVAGLTGGGFVVTWQSAGQDGSGLGVYGQRFNAFGAKLGGEFRVNTTTAQDQSLPSVTALSDGGFAVAWQSDGTDGSGLGVYAQRYSSTGGKAHGEFRVNSTTANDQWQPKIAGFSDGGFLVTWTSNLQDGSGYGVYEQMYDASGRPVSWEFPVNTVTANDQWQPAVAAFSGGSFVVVWTSKNEDGSLEGVDGQRFLIVP
ncbi:MAG TPA: Ig-like domain repeat protein [Pseudolabrys sp.]|nr:Ig-like domain repeat protein [Pseudolabrys sp.]